MGLPRDPKPAIAELASLLNAGMTPAQTATARSRGAARGENHRAERETLRREAENQIDLRPISPLCLMDRLARILPDNVAVVEESPTTTGC